MRFLKPFLAGRGYSDKGWDCVCSYKVLERQGHNLKARAAENHLSARRSASWRRDARGSAAIEFTLLAVPFTLFVVAIIELALMFAGGFVLQGSVNNAARLIRTGQLQQAQADPEEMFAETLCATAGILLNCGEVEYDVRTLDSFLEVDATPNIDEEGVMTDPEFDVGGVSDVVMVRASYLYPLMTPGISRFFSDAPGNKKLLMSTVIFETEPYEFEDD